MKRQKSREIAMELLFSMELSKNSVEETIEMFIENYEMNLDTIDNIANLYENGITIIWAVGRTKAIQKFVEALSYKIGSKCDWSFTAGRAHIDVLKDDYNNAIKVIEDKEFLNQFIVPYSEESYDAETYFNII